MQCIHLSDPENVDIGSNQELVIYQACYFILNEVSFMGSGSGVMLSH